MKKKILISTGGSGGHVIPGTIFYNHLKDNFDTYICSDKRGLNYFEKTKFNLKIIDVPQIGKNYFKLIFFFTAMFRAFNFLFQNKIELVISTGGYMSLPICIAAKILNCKIYLFEPNMVIGRSNLFFLKFCKKIFCYSNEILNFPEKYSFKKRVIYPLLKKEIFSYNKINNFDFKRKVKLLLIGGSQGADFFQTELKESVFLLSKKFNIEVNHQCTKNNFNLLSNFYKEKNIEYKIFNFKESIYNYINNADLCITRAGASSLAELTYLNKLFISIPFPFSKDNHQLLNALHYKNKNCCWVLEQNQNTIQEVVNLIEEIVSNPKKIEVKLNQMKKISYQNNWNNINQKMIDILNEN